MRQWQPLHVDLKKRLVKAAKVCIRDAGLLHSLLGIEDLEALFGHPALGASFGGFAIEQILASLPASIDAAFYRTHTGDELDLVLTKSSRNRVAIEIKFSSAPTPRPGMSRAMQDIGARRGFVVVPEGERFPINENVEAIALPDFVAALPRAAVTRLVRRVTSTLDRSMPRSPERSTATTRRTDRCTTQSVG